MMQAPVPANVQPAPLSKHTVVHREDESPLPAAKKTLFRPVWAGALVLAAVAALMLVWREQPASPVATKPSPPAAAVVIPTRYRESLELYTSALATPSSDKLRAYNGIYLANARLGRRDAAAEAFGKIVDYGLASKRLAMKFLFDPGSTAFVSVAAVSANYPVWLRQIARGASQRMACLEIGGHTSRTGPEPLNERLSLLRAEVVRHRLVEQAPALGNRLIATGAGSRDTLIGTGRDDLTDALDRRVVFTVIDC